MGNDISRPKLKEMRAEKFDYSSFFQRLKQTIELYKNQSAAAEAAAVPDSAVSDYKLGNREPKFSTVCLLAESKGVDLHWLATGEGDMMLGGPDNSAFDEDFLQFIYDQIGAKAKRDKVKIKPEKHFRAALWIYRHSRGKELIDGKPQISEQEISEYVELISE